ncbi:hypothetical protein [Dyadobacter jiangsuensis]|uniref:N-acetyltransferase domain-containing protein n=1 Tax=Dyadobacter jiangsuensis TaxID=1591085 RepID=A0A2P8G223_9BACT|nr:hypothetical protein [Dyadobacter jiangsuensis]PSL28023.1 hypothetical protein CLV60_107288 [Dyadobacter jiangsuensis]
MSYPKFAGIDFSKHDVVEFNPAQTEVGAGFRCGRRLMDWAMKYVISELVPRLGIRFLTVDALFDADMPEKPYDASGFYAKLGFRYTNPDEHLPPPDGFRTMYFDLMPLIHQINKIKNTN